MRASPYSDRHISIADGVSALHELLPETQGVGSVHSMSFSSERMGHAHKVTNISEDPVDWPTYLANVMSGSGAASLSFDVSADHEAYLRDVDAVRGKILQVGAPVSGDIKYPHGSVEGLAMLAMRAGGRVAEMVRHELGGKALLSLLPAEHVQKLADEVGARTIVQPEAVYKANSKSWLRASAAEGGYSVPDGVEIHTVDELSTKLDALKQRLARQGVDMKSMKFWVKIDALAGGEGVFPLGPDESVRTVIAQLDKACQSAEFYTPTRHMSLKDRLNAYLAVCPLVIECDLVTSPDTKQVMANYNVQGMIHDEGVALTGSSAQQTHNGVYLGNTVPLDAGAMQYAGMAEEQFLLAAEAARKMGYRGYAGGDVIVREKSDGSVAADIFDLNGRYNLSTPFQVLAQRYSEHAGAPLVGMWADRKLPVDTRDFGAVQECLNGTLFRAEESGYRGLLPLAAHDTVRGSDNTTMRFAIFAESRADLLQLLAEAEARGVTDAKH